jgi:hypothetical protein
MQLAITAFTVIAGMAFSLAIALLTEELVFGKFFRLIFARQAIQARKAKPLSNQRRKVCCS